MDTLISHIYSGIIERRFGGGCWGIRLLFLYCGQICSWVACEKTLLFLIFIPLAAGAPSLILSLKIYPFSFPSV